MTALDALDAQAELYAALVCAQAEATTAPLDGRNEAHDYNYTKAATMARAGKDLLTRHGLALIPLSLDVVAHASTTLVPSAMRGESPTTVETTEYNVARTFALVHRGGGRLELSVAWPCYLQGGKRPLDKAVAASDTTLLGYVYRDLLVIGRLREGEVDERDDEYQGAPGVAVAAPPSTRGRGADRAPVAAARVELSQPGRTAAAIGVTPAPAGQPASDLAVDLPPDPTVDDLEFAGWEPAVAAQLAALPAARLVERATVNGLLRQAAQIHGLKQREAAARWSDEFGAVGVEVAQKQCPTGYQLRLFALRIGGQPELPF